MTVQDDLDRPLQGRPPEHDHDHHHEHDHDHHHDHDAEDFTPPLVAPPGPIAQSVTIGFLAIYAATILLGLVWLASNARQIAPDSQAVVFRFGRIVRTQEAGLLLALPRPIEQVRLLPGPDRQLSQTVQPLPPSGGIAALPASGGIAALPTSGGIAALPTSGGIAALPASGGIDAPPATATTPDAAATPGVSASTPPGAAPYLTGDGNVVLLDATLIYRIADPQTYILAQDHVGPALDRLFRAAAVQVTAARTLNDFLVSRPSTDAGAASVTQLRGVVRDDLLRGINARLAALALAGQGLGVEVERIDMTAWLPPQAKVAFDAVLTATQVAEQGVAAARTDAERRRQGAAREQDRLRSTAQAAATEKVTNAHVDTARIVSLQREETPANRDSLVLQAYRAELATVMRRVGGVTLVDPQSGARVILSGGSS